MQFRPSSLAERKGFYSKEFSISKVKSWFKQNKIKLPQLCALDAGSETGIIKKKKHKGIHFYFLFDELSRKIKKYIPEDVYYVRNSYRNPKKTLKIMKINSYEKQELVFDIDTDNMKCRKVCNTCIKKAFNAALELKKELKKYGFKKIQIVYSGRGFHVHVFDKKAYGLSNNERKVLTKKLERFPIDPWVSRGYIDLIRMPYSLNGLVSRKVIPVRIRFNLNKTIPKFLKK